WLIDHEYYRVASSTLLHAGYVHLMLNLFVLGVLGSALEQVISAIRFINIFLVASLSGYFAFYFLSSYNFGTGASGGLFGLWGAYFALRLNTKNICQEASIPFQCDILAQSWYLKLF
ncbi:MAG: rhomboid family intramembrane serine protease, partial [Pseudohongiellaceae bacterium]